MALANLGKKVGKWLFENRIKGPLVLINRVFEFKGDVSHTLLKFVIRLGLRPDKNIRKARNKFRVCISALREQ